MRLRSGVKNGAKAPVFYGDMNGLQMQKRNKGGAESSTEYSFNSFLGGQAKPLRIWDICDLRRFCLKCEAFPGFDLWD